MSVPPGYNPAASMLSGGQNATILPVQGGGGMDSPPGYNYTASLLKGGLDQPIIGVQGGGAFLVSVPEVTQARLIPAMGRSFSIRFPNQAAIANWKALQFTEGEADFLNTIEPGDFVGMFESPEEAGMKIATFLENVVTGRCTEFSPYQLSSDCFKTREFQRFVKNRKGNMSGTRRAVATKAKPIRSTPQNFEEHFTSMLTLEARLHALEARGQTETAQYSRLHAKVFRMKELLLIYYTNQLKKLNLDPNLRQLYRSRYTTLKDELELERIAREGAAGAAAPGGVGAPGAAGVPNLFEPPLRRPRGFPGTRIPVPVSPGLSPAAAAAPAGLANLGAASRGMNTPATGLGAAAAAVGNRRNNLTNRRARVARLATSASPAAAAAAAPATPELARANAEQPLPGAVSVENVGLTPTPSVAEGPATVATVLAGKRAALARAEQRLTQAQAALNEVGGQRFTVRPTYLREDITGTQVPIYINTKNNKLFGNIRRGLRFYRLKADTADALKEKFTPEALSGIDRAESEVARAQAAVQSARVALYGAQAAEKRQTAAEVAAARKAEAARVKYAAAQARAAATRAAGPQAVEAAKPTVGQRVKSFFSRSKGGRSTRKANRKNRSTRKANRNTRSRR